MQTVQDIARRLNDLKSKENLAVTVLEDSDRISLRAIHSEARFDMERTADGNFSVGFPPMPRNAGQTQVTNGPRVSHDPTDAIAKAETWMRKFKA
jgi:hypothetical protein